MAVAFTSKFYQASAWKDISKIVYTSPNMVSPNVVGTRSHILPGQGDLGLWYEDTSNMYRISGAQSETETDYYNYKVSLTEDLDKDNPPVTITVSGSFVDSNIFLEYIKTGIGCSITGFEPINMSTEVQEYRVKLEYSTNATTSTEMGYLPNIKSEVINNIGTAGTFFYYDLSATVAIGDSWNTAWVMPIITGVPECYFEVDLFVPKKITKIYMKAQYVYDISAGTYFHKRFFGNYTIHAKLNSADAWTLLYTGANTTAIDATIILSTADFFRYFKLTILNNTGLSGFNASYYGLSALKFYEYVYNDIPTRDKPLYSFYPNGEADIIYISDITTSSGNLYVLDVSSVSATTSGILSSNTELQGWGALSGSIDFKTDNSIVFEITVGEAYNCRLTAWDDVTHSTVLNDLIAGDHVRVSAVVYCATNSKLNPTESFSPINNVWGPVHNQILKGNTVYYDQNLFYGDFNMVYRYQTGVYGDYLIFKPMLYNITQALPYGIHDFIITLHYSYT